jgi:hypothetical protein
VCSLSCVRGFHVTLNGFWWEKSSQV